MASLAVSRIVARDGKTVKWRAQVRVVSGGKLIYSQAKTLDTKALAQRWGNKRRAELEAMSAAEVAELVGGSGGETIGDLIRRYQSEYKDLGRMGRTKTDHLKFLLTQPLADLVATKLRSADLVEHIRGRREAGTGPATAMNDLIWLRVVFKLAKPAWGLAVDAGAINEAMTHLKAHGLVGRANRRERRPSADELARLDAFFKSRDGRASIPMTDIMWFAVHSGRREGEMTRLLWADLNDEDLTGVVRDLKHPRNKSGNDRFFKFTRAGWDIVQRQPRGDARVFPYEAKSVSAAFTRACSILEIKDLRFHDLRHEATSRLFEAGYSIQEVQLFTLHDDWSVLKRYVHLRPGGVVLK